MSNTVATVQHGRVYTYMA